MLNCMQLKNGVTVLMEPVSDAKSFSIGVLIKSGTIYEKISEKGISHFIEHLLFKGTGKYTQSELSEKFDDIGGRVNAYTGREVTYFYTHSLAEHWSKVIELLYDMISNSIFTVEDIEKEKSVIMEEINGDNDDPEAILSDMLAENILAETPYEGKILGNEETVRSFNYEILSSYYTDRYVSDNIILSVVGNFDPNVLLSLLDDTFGMIRSTKRNIQDGNQHIKFPNDFEFTARHISKHKNLDQIHLVFSFPGFSYHDPKVYTISLLSTLLGGSASSRLFQNIREAAGLVYDIDSYPVYYQECGMLCINTAINVEKYDKTFELIHREFQMLKSNLPGEKELTRAKELLKTNIILDWENPLDRVEDYAIHMNIYGKKLDVEEEIRKIDQVTLAEMHALIDETIDYSKMGICVLHDPSLGDKITHKIEQIFV